MSAPVPVSCSHSNLKKVARIGNKCAICNTRVWKFWKTRKCRDCKIVLHRSCVTACEQNTAARQAVVPVSMPRVAPAEAQENRVAPLYAAPWTWNWENVTAVVVDCRSRRAVPLTVTVGHELTTAGFAELFEPSSRPRTAVVPQELRSSAHPSVVEAVIAELAEAFSRWAIAHAVGSMEQEAAGDGDHSSGKVECETSL